MHPSTNGNGAVVDMENIDKALERTLANKVTQAEARAADMKIAYMEAEADAKKYRKMLDLLRDEAPTPAKTTKASKRRDPNAWTISEDKILQVWQLIKERDSDEFKATDLHGQGVSTEAIRRSILHLRDRELIRKKAKLRGGGTLWALMPEAADVDDPATLVAA